MNLSSDAVDVILAAVGSEVPDPAPFLRRRFEDAEGILIVSLPRQENSEVVMRSLNRVAAAIYLFCDGNRSVETIVAELRALFPREDPRHLSLEVIRTVREMQSEGLLRTRRAGGLTSRTADTTSSHGESREAL